MAQFVGQYNLNSFYHQQINKISFSIGLLQLLARIPSIDIYIETVRPDWILSKTFVFCTFVDYVGEVQVFYFNDVVLHLLETAIYRLFCGNQARSIFKAKLVFPAPL